jgi:Do/DeqQ family serine protease
VAGLALAAALAACVVLGVDRAAAQVAAPTGAIAFPSLAPLLEEATPAVVNIAVLSRAPAQENPLMRDPFFRHFFNLPPAPQQGPPRMSAGSGVIVDAERGYVLTNNHVVANASEIQVTLKDRRRFKAKLLGTDPATDVAVLEISAEKLVALPFGDSDALRVGDYVIAIGNPFGLGQTVTSGIVSALGRSGLNIEGYEDFIQTDASINPGNSGGALIDLRGRLVGINTAIIAPAGGNVGIGFAVPSNMARSVMEQLIRHGEVRRGRLGVAVQDVTPDIADALNLDRSTGALISTVEPGSPADKAGLRPGDLVLEIGGRPVDGASDLRNQVGLVAVGERLDIVYQRDGRRLTTTARVGEGSATAGGTSLARLPGAVLRNLEPGMPGYGRLKGVLVESLEQGSPAWRAGLRPGDVVVAVNRQEVTSVADVESIFARRPRAIALNVLRGDTMVFIVIQ